MRYQNPQLLYFLFAIAIPILIHLFNFRKHKTIYFSSIRFLKEIKEDNRKRSNLKNILILISRILAISCLVLVFARPYIPSNTQQKITTIFIYVDNSFSMDADGGDGRLLNIAKEKARIICNSYPSQSNFYLLTNDFLSIHNNSYNANALVQYIDDITSSSRIKSLDQLINRQQTLTDENSHLYIISDMQSSTITLDEINKIDSNLHLFFTPITAQKQSNISIDSCWVNSPMLTTEKEIELFVSVSNHSDAAIDEEVIFLTINGKQKSQQYINLNAHEQKEIRFNFSTDNSIVITGRILINDAPITFDNKLYFTLHRTKKINIFCINQAEENKALNTLFLNDTALVNYQNFSVNNINYNAIVKQDLVIINQVEELSSGLLNTLNKITESGGSILLIPPGNIKLSNYNLLLQQLGLNTIESIKSQTIEISKINIEHALFNKVFEGKVDKINYPTATHYFATNTNKISTPLLSFENNKPFLSVYEKGKGLIYQLNSPLDNEFNNFCKHALFVPTLLNIATQSIPLSELYNTIDEKEYFTSNFKNKKNELLHLTNNRIDIIPTTKTIGGKTYYYTHNQVIENGVYSLVHNTKILDEIAFNYSTAESKIQPLNKEEIKGWVSRNNLHNVELISSDLAGFKQAIKEQQNGKEFWKIALLLALLFFAIEILFIKLITL